MHHCFLQSRVKSRKSRWQNRIAPFVSILNSPLPPSSEKLRTFDLRLSTVNCPQNLSRSEKITLRIAPTLVTRPKPSPLTVVASSVNLGVLKILSDGDAEITLNAVLAREHDLLVQRHIEIHEAGTGNRVASGLAVIPGGRR